MGFTGTKSIERAESAVKRHFPWIKSCTFRDCRLRAINVMIHYLLRMQKLFPEAARLIEAIEIRDFSAELGSDAPVAHRMASFDAGKKTLLLHPRLYVHHSIVPTLCGRTFKENSFSGTHDDVAYSIVHAFGHVLLEWISAAEHAVTIKDHSGRAADVLFHYMQPHPLDHFVSSTATRSNEEMIAEATVGRYLNRRSHNVDRTMELVHAIVEQIRR